MMDEQTINLVYAIAERAGKLANEKIEGLRLINGYGCNTPKECHDKDWGKTRGEIIEEILIAEFIPV